VDVKQVVNVTEALDGATITRFTLMVLALSGLIIFADGFDINNIAYVGPALISAWGIADRSALGPVFSASLFGILVGAPILGYLGDRYGRKKAIVASGLIFSIFTWAAIFTHSLGELFAVRVICGVGIGGLLPNVIALNAEFAPRRLRATLVILMFSGIGLGSAIPGPVAAWLVPQHGWQVMFTIGGILGLLATAACALGLPESVKYHVVRGHSRKDIAALLQRVRPDLAIGADADFVLSDEKAHAGFAAHHLFDDGRAPLTFLLWIMFVSALMGYFFLISWTPTLLAAADIPVAKAALFTSVFQVGGLIGGWAICRPMDIKGMMPVALMFGIAIPVVAAIGYVATVSEILLGLVLFVAGFCVLGGQYAINAVSGMIYPTAFRSNGSGIAFAVGRVGSISGPVIGGALIAMHLPVHTLYLCAAIPFVICAPACLVFARLYDRKFHHDTHLEGTAFAPPLPAGERGGVRGARSQN
jgi:AAHS family 4-hydroxybenzoate transporter-like MFS transporter